MRDVCKGIKNVSDYSKPNLIFRKRDGSVGEDKGDIES